MKQFTQRELIKICIANGFHFERMSGDHAVYINKEGRHISIPNHLRCVIAHRLIKENNLEINLKNTPNFLYSGSINICEIHKTFPSLAQ